MRWGALSPKQMRTIGRVVTPGRSTASPAPLGRLGCWGFGGNCSFGSAGFFLPGVEELFFAGLVDEDLVENGCLDVFRSAQGKVFFLLVGGGGKPSSRDGSHLGIVADEGGAGPDGGANGHVDGVRRFVLAGYPKDVFCVFLVAARQVGAPAGVEEVGAGGFKGGDVAFFSPGVAERPFKALFPVGGHGVDDGFPLGYAVGVGTEDFGKEGDGSGDGIALTDARKDLDELLHDGANLLRLGMLKIVHHEFAQLLDGYWGVFFDVALHQMDDSADGGLDFGYLHGLLQCGEVRSCGSI